MKNKTCVMFLALTMAVSGCATVDVTKTAIGFHSPTNPDAVEILMTLPKRDFIELATVSTTNWQPSQTAKMHNAMRAKSAPIGANAVVIMASGVHGDGGNAVMWTSGVALRYKE